MALVVSLVPTAGILEEDVLDGDAVTFTEIDILRTVGLVGTVQLERVLEEAAVDVLDHVVGRREAPAVDGAAAGDAHILLLDGEDHAGPADIRVLDIVPGVGRAEQGGAPLQMQRDIVLDVDGAGHPVARGEDDAAAAVGAGEIDGRLDAGRIERDAVRLGPEVRHVVVPGGQREHREGAQEESKKESVLHYLYIFTGPISPAGTSGVPRRRTKRFTTALSFSVWR